MEDTASPPGDDMQLDQIRQSLDSLDGARSLLNGCTLRDPEGGGRNLASIAAVLPPDGLRDLGPPLGRLLPRCPDPDMALNNLERFLAQPAGAEQLPLLLENRARTLEILLQLLSVSQSFSDLLGANPDYLDMLRVPLRRSPSPAEMQAQLQAEVDAALRGLGRPPRLPPLPPAATAPHRRQRRHPRPAARRDHPRHLAHRRRGPGGRPGHRPAPRRQALRPALHRGRPAGLLRRPRLRQARRRGAELQQRHRPDVRLRGGQAPPAASGLPASATTSFSPRSSARWCGCCRPTPTAAWPTASTCGCGRRATAARWPGRWPAPCPTTTRSAAPGSGRRSSRSARPPATSPWASASSRPSSRSSTANI